MFQRALTCDPDFTQGRVALKVGHLALALARSVSSHLFAENKGGSDAEGARHGCVQELEASGGPGLLHAGLWTPHGPSGLCDTAQAIAVDPSNQSMNSKLLYNRALVLSKVATSHVCAGYPHACSWARIPMPLPTALPPSRLIAPTKRCVPRALLLHVTG